MRGVAMVSADPTEPGHRFMGGSADVMPLAYSPECTQKVHASIERLTRLCIDLRHPQGNIDQARSVVRS